jgi:hypothetical protein
MNPKPGPPELTGRRPRVEEPITDVGAIWA